MSQSNAKQQRTAINTGISSGIAYDTARRLIESSFFVRRTPSRHFLLVCMCVATLESSQGNVLGGDILGGDTGQPPANVLEKMISVRLHLDPCDETNGALQVLSGSHRLGRIPEDRIPSILRDSTACV